MRSFTAAVAGGLLAAGLMATGPATAGAGTASAATAGAGTTPAFAATWDHGAGGERYVAFGDSFVAGPGISPQRPGGCARSEHNFATLLAQRLEAQAFTDASCSGARTVHYWEPQAVTGGTNPAQLDAVGSDTTLVTLGTMGGNDIGLVGLATQCVLGECAGTDGDEHHQAVDALMPALHRIVDDVRERAPQAQILAVGYGTYLPPEGCANLPGITPAEAVYLQGLIDHLSDTIEAVAAAEGIGFVDPRDLPGAIDHTPCAAPEEQWIRGLSTYGDGAPMHPSTLGMQVLARAVLTTIQHERGSAATLAAAAETVRSAMTCRGDRPARRRAVIRVRGGDGLLDRVTVSVGGRRFAIARTAPWRAVIERRRVLRRAGPGPVVVRARLRADGLTRTAELRFPRPRCLRR